MAKRKMTRTEANDLIAYATLAQDIFGGWKPYEYQKQALDDLFVKKLKYVFCDWPRKSGKSEVAAFFLTLKAIMKSYSENYYLSMDKENAEKVIWMRLKQLIPAKYLKGGVNGFKESSKEVLFANNSLIRLHGTNVNPDSLIGTTINSMVWDEYRTHKVQFHDVMFPNLFRSDCQILIASTPPDLLNYDQSKMYENTVKMCKEDANKSYHTMDCWHGNPDPEMQEFYKEMLHTYTARGRIAEFNREFLCQRVRGTSNSIMPEFNHDELIPHLDLMRMLKRCRNIKFALCGDSTGWTRWGVLFCAIDLETKDIYILDKLVNTCDGDTTEARESAGMHALLHWPQVQAKVNELTPEKEIEDWDLGWDCQDVPYMDDVRRWFGKKIRFLPVNKKSMLRQESFGLIRDLKKLNKFKISERCAELIDEFKALEVNRTTEGTKKKFDELIDCLRYVLYENEHLFNLRGLTVVEASVPLTPQQKDAAFIKTVLESQKRAEQEGPYGLGLFDFGGY